MEVQFSDLMELVELLLVALALFYMNRSVPADKVAELLDKAGQQADKTSTKLDDALVMIARMLNDIRLQQPDDGVTEPLDAEVIESIYSSPDAPTTIYSSPGAPKR